MKKEVDFLFKGKLRLFCVKKVLLLDLILNRLLLSFIPPIIPKITARIDWIMQEELHNSLSTPKEMSALYLPTLREEN